VIPKAFWNYFLTINVFNFPASALVAISGLQWFPISFCTFGLGMGLLAYHTFYKQQYYFYYNLGYTRTTLAVMVFICNLVIAIPLLLLLSL